MFSLNVSTVSNSCQVKGWERHLVLHKELNRSQSLSQRRYKNNPAITALALSRYSKYCSQQREELQTAFNSFFSSRKIIRFDVKASTPLELTDSKLSSHRLWLTLYVFYCMLYHNITDLKALLKHTLFCVGLIQLFWRAMPGAEFSPGPVSERWEAF